MARVEFGGRVFELAPYRLGAMRQAAAHLDRINAVNGALTTLEGATEAAHEIIEFLAIGIRKIDPEMTVEAIEEIVGLDDVTNLQIALMNQCIESGLARKGEVLAPSEQAEAGASSTSEDLESSSAESSAS